MNTYVLVAKQRGSYEVIEDNDSLIVLLNEFERLLRTDQLSNNATFEVWYLHDNGKDGETDEGYPYDVICDPFDMV